MQAFGRGAKLPTLKISRIMKVGRVAELEQVTRIPQLGRVAELEQLTRIPQLGRVAERRM